MYLSLDNVNTAIILLISDLRQSILMDILDLKMHFLLLLQSTMVRDMVRLY